MFRVKGYLARVALLFLGCEAKSFFTIFFEIRQVELFLHQFYT